jgi:hypothetical protein
MRHSGGVEELIEYGQRGYGDFELRSGDQIAFSYVGPYTIVTQNLTISGFTAATVRSDAACLRAFPGRLSPAPATSAVYRKL